MGLTTPQEEAIDRLKNKYNGGDYDASNNPGGMANDGHRVNFEPALQDTATVGEAAAEQAEAAAGYADAVRGVGLFFAFDDGTSDADPGDGKFRFNHATLSSATMLYIDVETVAETDVSDWIATWDDSNSTVRGELRLICATDAAVWAIFHITGSNVDASGYRKATVAYVDHAGTFEDGDEFAINFSRTGSKGDPGNDGEDGAPGADSTVPGPQGNDGPPSSLTFQFSTTTTDADPGTGKVRLNHATIASATSMFIDDAPLEGGSAAAWIGTWDDSTNAARRGTITLIDLGDRSNWAVFDVTGANTGASGYTKIAIAYVAGNGTFSDEAVLSVAFSRSGDKGADGEDGEDGEGSGNVNPTGSITEDNLASFADGTGNLIEDSGLSKSAVATAVSQAGTAVQPGDLGATATSNDYGDLDNLPTLGTAAAVDTGTSAGNVPVLDGSGKLLTSVLPEAILGGLNYQDGWNANTNSPTIPAAASGNKGHYYIVTTAGTTNVDGIAEWAVGDWIVSNGSAWGKVDSSDQVNSVAGLQGTITASNLRAALNVADGATANTGDVTAASAFSNDNRLLRSDGTGKGAQASGVTLSDANVLSGAAAVYASLVQGGQLSMPDTGTDHAALFQMGTDLTAARTYTFNMPDGSYAYTWPAGNAAFAALNLEDQTIAGGARVTVKDLGTLTTGTLTVDPGDRPMQKCVRNGAFTLAPGSNKGSFYLSMVNGASAGALTTSGWGKVVGDSLTNTNGDKFLLIGVVDDDGSVLSIIARQ